MKLPEICLLKEGDTVTVYGKKRTVKEKAANETIRCGNKKYYYSELQPENTTFINSNYNPYSFLEQK